MAAYNMTIFEIEKENFETVIVPVGSFEQHGPHLPLTTDCIIAQAYADRIAEKLGAFCLPVLPISTCREHMGKRGSTWMDPDVFYQMLRSIILSLKEQGFKKVIIVQSHGGIFTMTPLLRQMNAENDSNFKVCRVDLLSLYDVFKKEGLLETDDNVHACEHETSLLLHLCPELVRKDKIKNFVPDAPREYLNYDGIFRLSPSGVWGNPESASAEKGEKYLLRGTAAAVEYINSSFDYMDGKTMYGKKEK